MKVRVAFLMLSSLMLAFAVPTFAQESSEAARNVDNLRAELSNTQDRVADVKIRLEQLDYDLRPENIERHFSAVGSTRPEELRESRRRQLQTEKDRLVTQLDQLAVTTTRLEAAISSAQAKAYEQSIGTVVLNTDQNRNPHFLTLVRVLMLLVVLCLILGGIALRIVSRRGQKV